MEGPGLAAPLTSQERKTKSRDLLLFPSFVAGATSGYAFASNHENRDLFKWTNALVVLKLPEASRVLRSFFPNFAYGHQDEQIPSSGGPVCINNQRILRLK